jgi:dihydropyrimidinase/allantoinase
MWINNCFAITSRGIERKNVYIHEGVIAALTDEVHEQDNGIDVINGTGKILIPGMIDQHTHIREPGGYEHENFVSGTAAAVTGGVTTILEMPIADKPVTSIDQLLIRINLAQEKSYVNYGFYGGAGVGSLDKIDELASAGVIGFKTFMCRPDPHREMELAGLWAETNEDLYAVFSAVAKTGLPLAVHAEDGFLVREYEKRGKKGTESRPPDVEINAVKRAAKIALETGVKLIFCHLSTSEAIEIAIESKNRGAEIFIECAPHHLFLSMEDVVGFETYAKVKPPLRSRVNVNKIWKYINQDYIDTIASDHAPYHIKLKQQDEASAPYGIPGIELSLRLMIDAVLKNWITWEKLVTLVSSNPAKIFDIKQKGNIEVGADADLVMVNPEASYIIDVEKLKSKSAGSAIMYDGKKLLGDIDLVLVNGSIVSKNNQLVGDKGGGRNVAD